MADKLEDHFETVMGLPHLDVHTVSEDWALGQSLVAHWNILSRSFGKVPSQWLDSRGDRMYGAVMALETEFDLDDIIREDDNVAGHCRFLSVRKPHAWSETTYSVDGKVKAKVRILTSFIKRDQKGSNKKFSKVRNIWNEEDLNPDLVDNLLEEHDRMKQHPTDNATVSEYEVNRIQDFNTADFMYFKNYIRIAKAAEWKQGRDANEAPRLNKSRRCFFYGNVADGATISTRVGDADGMTTTSHHRDDGRAIFVSLSERPTVEIAER